MELKEKIKLSTECQFEYIKNVFSPKLRFLFVEGQGVGD
jgi:hypothetical protein